MGDRTILHCDCNSYYASVELLSHPELRDQPVAVCGDPKSRHGVILAKNEAAKAFGVQTAETVWQARRKCPPLVLLPAHHDLYQQYYEQINRIYLSVTDQVEAFSIDESWLDVTGSRRLFGDGLTIANLLRRRVREETGLTISVGVSFNKPLAKMGSDFKKPDAVTCLTRENFKSLLHPLPVERMLFVGPAARERLNARGVMTIGDLARCREDMLLAVLGKNGPVLGRWANGEDEAPVRPWGQKEPVKSVGSGLTFPQDLRGESQWKQGLIPLCEQVGARLRAQHLKCRTLALQVKDPNFRVISRQMKMEPPTHLTRALFEGSLALLRAMWQPEAPIRMLTVTASGLMDADTPVFEQMDLLNPVKTDGPRQAMLETAIDHLRSRYGPDAVAISRTLDKPGD